MDFALLAQHIGSKIARKRHGLSFTQETLALEAFVDRTYLRKVEKGRTNVSLRILRKLARSLGTSVYDLVR